MQSLLSAFHSHIYPKSQLFQLLIVPRRIKMIIRKETEKDFDRIYDLVKVAFQTAKVSNGKEQDFATELRNSGNYIPELALVAEEDGKLIGHIMLTKMYITTGDGKFEALLIAPISVLLEYRNKGVGSELINESFRLAGKGAGLYGGSSCRRPCLLS